MSKHKKGILDDLCSYLAGPMNFAKDDGVLWRNKFKELMAEGGVKAKFFDPTQKPDEAGELVKKEKEYCRKLKEKAMYEEVTRFVKSFQDVDLRAVQKSDFIVAMIDTSVHMFGTIEEIVRAHDQNKPIFAILPNGKMNAPDWSFGRIKHTEMFETIEDCANHIIGINNGDIYMDKRWVLVDKGRDNEQRLSIV